MWTVEPHLNVMSKHANAMSYLPKNNVRLPKRVKFRPVTILDLCNGL